MNRKVVKKWQRPPPISTSTPAFQGCPPFLAKFLAPPQVTQFLEGPTPPLIRGRGGGQLCNVIHTYFIYPIYAGFKSNTAECDLSTILPEEVEEEVKAAAEISMGTDISEEDIENVSYLCEQIIQIAEYRMSLYDYLKNRMQAVAPNLTVLVGELVGARLIAHAGLFFPTVTERIL